MLDKNAVLKQYFGHSSFRPGQETVVNAILQGRDVLCVMPTGAGKSICYQVPALAFDGITIVVSPLISLMKDQVNALTQNGIRAAYLNSSLTPGQYAKAVANVKNGVYKIIYVAPERLAVSNFLDACRGLKIDLLAVDEAHCISQWGQDFRPGYLKIAEFVDALGYRPVIAAFTATATAEVKVDIEGSLGLVAPLKITTGFDRPNLRFEVLRPKHKYEELLQILRRHPDDSGIIYCSTRKTVEQLGEKLAREGFVVTTYHAGLDDEVRKGNQEDFVYDRKSIMVATNAFGMGIDKSNVAYVVHFNMPMDIESYYQEAGRAGRDGSPAECILLYSAADVMTNRFLIESSEPNPELSEEEQQTLRERDYDRLKQMVFYSTTSGCLRNFILEYFGEQTSHECGNCSSCLTQFEDVDVTAEAQKILTCIKRTDCHFGRRMICNILLGKKSERISRLFLDSRTFYGSMREYDAHRLKQIISFLEQEGYICSVGCEYPVLAVTDKASAVLCGGERVMMKQEVEKPYTETKPLAPSKRARSGVASSHSVPSGEQKSRELGEIDLALLSELKLLRRALAEDRNVAAYMIFTDATLMDMCRRLPVTKDELLEVSGVGKVKQELYGELFLRALRAHCMSGG